jgi:hypothetical protein
MRFCRAIFHSLIGRDDGFAGHIACKVTAGVPRGKRIFVWTVLARRREVGSRLLCPRIHIAIRRQAGEQLIGGRAGSIILTPATVTSHLGDEVVPSVLNTYATLEAVCPRCVSAQIDILLRRRLPGTSPMAVTPASAVAMPQCHQQRLCQ